MTIKDHLIALRDDFTFKTAQYIQAEQKLSEEANGFFDKKLLDDLSEAKAAWQKSANEYHSFFSRIVHNKLNINAEMP